MIERLKKSQKPARFTRTSAICSPSIPATWHSGRFMFTGVPTHCAIPHDAAAKHLFCRSTCSGCEPWQPAQLATLQLTTVTIFWRVENDADTRTSSAASPAASASRSRTFCSHASSTSPRPVSGTSIVVSFPPNVPRVTAPNKESVRRVNCSVMSCATESATSGSMSSSARCPSGMCAVRDETTSQSNALLFVASGPYAASVSRRTSAPPSIGTRTTSLQS